MPTDRRTSYRLTQRRYQESAFSGTGSLRRSGRWHAAGLPVVYTSESAAVALLEVLVHVERPRLVTMDLVVVPCRFDETLCESVEAYVEAAELPDDWRRFPWPVSTQQIGRRWFEEGRTPVLAVPSAVLPAATNYLVNPEHARFAEITIGAPEPFEVDPRLGR